MSKPNGRQKKAIEELAEALRPPPVERLAAALTECFDAAVEAGEKRTRQAAREATREAIRDEMGDVKETLRMVWRQCGGKADERLPIDD
jgi:hypothetical protein